MHAFLEGVADAFNPLLAIMALVVVGLEWRRSWKGGVVRLTAAALGLAGIYGVSAVDSSLGMWARWSGDYSLHTAFAVSVGTSVAIWRQRWRARIIVLVGAYLVLVVTLRYHTVVDVVSASIVAVIVTMVGHLAMRSQTRAVEAKSRPA